MLAGHQLLAFLAALAAVLLLGRAAGDLARRVGQPEVLGQFVVGVLLGPGVLGWIAPGLQEEVFRGDGSGSALAGLSQLGAVLLLLVAGLEVDLRVLRAEARTGAVVALAAIVPSLAAGVLLGPLLGLEGTAAAFLGVVLSVTALSVVTTLLLESGQMRRRYAQVLLAGGVAGELVAWVLVSVLSASRSGSPLTAGALSVALAVGFLAVAGLVGPRLVAASMRSTADRSLLPEGRLTLVLALTLLFGAATDALGLHPLLGAFVFGVLLTRSPRVSGPLLERIETLVVAFFAPVFFVLAGAQVNVREVATLSALGHIGLLLVVATVLKVGPVALAARLSRIRGAEAWLVGVGANLKGGTDVLIAILGQQLGLLSVQAYTEYAVVAIITVLASPTLLRMLQRRAPVSGAEAERLDREEASRQAYLPGLQRVLVPMAADLRPSLAAEVVDRLASSLADQDRLIDITQMRVGHEAGAEPPDESAVGHGLATLAGTSERRNIVLRDLHAGDPGEVVDEIITAAGAHDLLAIGAALDPEDAGRESTGPLTTLHNEVIDAAPIDVLVAAGRDHQLPWDSIGTILVPVNSTAHARAAGELAGHLARSCGATVVLLHIGNSATAEVLQRRVAQAPEPSAGPFGDLQYLLRPLDVDVRERQVEGAHPAEVLAEELAGGAYDLVVAGCLDRSGDRVAYFGPLVEAVLTQRAVPYVLLVTHDQPTQRTVTAGA